MGDESGLGDISWDVGEEVIRSIVGPSGVFVKSGTWSTSGGTVGAFSDGKLSLGLSVTVLGGATVGTGRGSLPVGLSVVPVSLGLSGVVLGVDGVSGGGGWLPLDGGGLGGVNIGIVGLGSFALFDKVGLLVDNADVGEGSPVG